MKKIKIAHIITRMILGGAQENTLHTCRELGKDPKYEVTLITGPGLGPEGDLLQTLKRKEPFHLIVLPQMRREINPVRDFIVFFQLFWLFLKNRYNIVHTHSSKAGILGRWAAFFTGIPIRLHTVHGWGFHPYQFPLIRELYICLERITAWITTRLIVVSKLNSQKGLQLKIGNPKKYQTIYSGIEVKRFQTPAPKKIVELKEKFKIPQNKTVIGMVGRFVAQKNPDLLIEIAKKLTSKHKNFFFLMIGDGPLKESLEKKIHQEGLESFFLLPGLQREVQDWIYCLDLVLFPSKWEGLPRVLLQSMAAGKCVLASPADGILEVVKNKKNGQIIRSFNASSWATAILELSEKSALRKKLGEEAQKTVTTQFSDAKMILDLKHLLTELEPL